MHLEFYKRPIIQSRALQALVIDAKAQWFDQMQHAGVQHLLHLKSKSKILQPIEIMGFFMNFFVKFKEIFCCNCCIFISDVI